MREQVEEAVKRLQDHGIENLRYFDGRQLFGEELVTDCLPDGLHPNGDGYEKMGQNFVEHVLSEFDL